MGTEKTLVNVNKGQDPYSVIGNYISNHVTVVEDMIAVIQINGAITNELYMVDTDTDPVSCFYWLNDWWEGEEDVALLDFFPVSDAGRIKRTPCNDRDTLPEDDLISRWAETIALREELKRNTVTAIRAMRVIAGLASAQTGPHYDEWCTDCKEYDQERHCCPRWNRVISQTVKEIKAQQRKEND